MDLLRIAARVAQTTAAVPGDGGGKMEISVEAVLPSVEAALAKIQAGAPEAGLEGPLFSWMSQEAEYGAGMSVDGDMVRIFTTVHHDTELIYEAPRGQFDTAAAADSLAADMQNGLEQFNEMFPDEGDEGDEDHGPPSSEGSPYDTLEEKKGLK